MTARPGTDQEHGPPPPAGPGPRPTVPSRLLRWLLRWLLSGLRAVGRLILGPVRAVVRMDVSPLATYLAGVGGRRRPELSWLLWWLVTGFLAVVLLSVNVVLAVEDFGVPPLVAFVTGLAQSTALILIPVRPRAATAVQFLAVAVLAVSIQPSSDSTWPLTVPGLITLLAHFGLIAARTSRRTALATWWGGTLLLTVAVALDPRGRPFTDGLPMMVLYPSLSALVLGGVLLFRRWRGIRRELADARRDVEVEQSQRAVAEERTRIARELHDVVAHSMSVIHMQAISAAYRIHGLDPEAKAEFARIAADARSAMREMRQLLAVLRDESADPHLAPVPDLARLPELIASAERAGVPVDLRVTPAVGAAALPESVGLTAYRIVQESLSNVIRHAPGARTTVRLDRDGDDLVVSVVNAASLPPAQPLEVPGKAGHGLPGMRERVRLVGGSLETGAGREGGYRVAARLPIGGDG